MLDQINSLIAATKEGTGLFGDISNLLLNLLPTSWATTIKHLILIIAVIISLPIIFFVLLVSLRCIRLFIWCYRPLCIHCLSFSCRSFSFVSYTFTRFMQSLARYKVRNATQQEAVEVLYSALPQEHVAVTPRTNRVKAKKATSKII